VSGNKGVDTRNSSFGKTMVEPAMQVAGPGQAAANDLKWLVCVLTDCAIASIKLDVINLL
jgi:hypothetical protein